MIFSLFFYARQGMEGDRADLRLSIILESPE